MSEYELVHYGVQGMKWGVRKDPGRTSARAYKAAKKEYGKNQKLAKKYFKESKKVDNPALNKYGKRLHASDARLTAKVETYLDTLFPHTVKDLLKVDIEHGYTYVNTQLLDKKVYWDSHTPVTDEFAKKYK